MMGRAPTRHKPRAREFTQSLPAHEARTFQFELEDRQFGPDHSLSARPRRGTIVLRPGPRKEALHPARTLPIALLIAFVLVAVAASSMAGAGGPPTAILVASPSAITAGDTVKLSGSVGDVPSCLGSRPVQLEWRRADSASWATVASTNTAGDGTFSLSDGPQYSGEYRVSLAAVGACQAAGSDPVPVGVRALVDSSLIASSLTAGSCPVIHATVSPNKSGQNVELQRLFGSAWQTVETLPLDASSSASTSPCFGWEDIGVVRLRMRWPKQDQLNESGIGIVLALRIEKANWMRRIDHLVAGRAVSVSVGSAGSFLYQRADTKPRIPASNEKLLLSMALLDSLGPGGRIETHAATASLQQGVVQGNLWILGRGDPEITAARMGALARDLVAAGVEKVRGRVMGSTGYFAHDWWARGWKRQQSRLYVAPPTALTFQGNVVNGRFTREPEAFAARSLTKQLEKRGVAVVGRAGSGEPPEGLADIAVIQSRPLRSILAAMDRPSDNFYAEVLGKLLGANSAGPPGTIAKGAAAVRDWVAEQGVHFSLYDGSGLSYANRVTARGIVQLLWVADAATWGPVLREALASGGQGTLEDRLHGVKVRAKTGSLDGVSALSGWVWLDREGGWTEFSILSRGMPKWIASSIEDAIVRVLIASAR
jgi:serine-type D-Ala-D-Ala carboxypeptidase/endopeptidase (penicillin-binding protein 4)